MPAGDATPNQGKSHPPGPQGVVFKTSGVLRNLINGD